MSTKKQLQEAIDKNHEKADRTEIIGYTAMQRALNKNRLAAGLPQKKFKSNQNEDNQNE